MYVNISAYISINFSLYINTFDNSETFPIVWWTIKWFLFSPASSNFCKECVWLFWWVVVSNKHGSNSVSWDAINKLPPTYGQTILLACLVATFYISLILCYDVALSYQNDSNTQWHFRKGCFRLVHIH